MPSSHRQVLKLEAVGRGRTVLYTGHRTKKIEGALPADTLDMSSLPADTVDMSSGHFAQEHPLAGTIDVTD